MLDLPAAPMFANSLIPEIPALWLLSTGSDVNKIMCWFPFCSCLMALNTSYVLMSPESLSDLCAVHPTVYLASP